MHCEEASIIMRDDDRMIKCGVCVCPKMTSAVIKSDEFKIFGLNRYRLCSQMKDQPLRQFKFLNR